MSSPKESEPEPSTSSSKHLGIFASPDDPAPLAGSSGLGSKASPTEGTNQSAQESTDPKEKSKSAEKTSNDERPPDTAIKVEGFLEWNVRYFLQLRGIFNMLHFLCSLITMAALAHLCQLRLYDSGPYEGFFCKPPETYLFVVSCSSFFTSFLYLCSCLLSKQTDTLIYKTSFEVSYFILFFILLSTASISVMISGVTWGSERMMYGQSNETIQVAAVFGLIAGVLYGASSVWFFLSHSYYRSHEDGVWV